MAMRTGRGGRRVPTRSRSTHPRGAGTAKAARPARPVAETTPERPGDGVPRPGANGPTGAQQRASWQKRYAEARERQSREVRDRQGGERPERQSGELRRISGRLR